MRSLSIRSCSTRMPKAIATASIQAANTEMAMTTALLAGDRKPASWKVACACLAAEAEGAATALKVVLPTRSTMPVQLTADTLTALSRAAALALRLPLKAPPGDMRLNSVFVTVLALTTLESKETTKETLLP